MTVKADDGTCSDTRDVTVTVPDVDEEGMAPLSSQEPVVGAGPTASLTDADGASPAKRGSGPGSMPDGAFTDIATAPGP